LKVKTDLPLLLKNRGISVKRLSEITDIPRVYLHYIVNGKMVPTDEQLEAICQTLQITSDMVYPSPETRKALMEI